jgi:excisionase family DNA binding protein
MSGITLQEAADRLGVHYMTAYRYVRLGKLPASKEGTAWVVDEADVEAFSAEPPAPRAHDDWRGDLVRLLVAGDPTAAWTLVEDALVSSFTPETVHTELLLPAMRDIGDLWIAGEIDIADEHLASAVARRLGSRLSPRFVRRGRDRGTVVVAMGPGEWHQLGAEVLADLLRGRNFRVLYLGANTPPEAVAKAAENSDDLVAICVAAFASADGLAEVADLLEGSGVPLVFGGPAAVSQADVERLGGDVFGESIPGIVDWIDENAV